MPEKRKWSVSAFLPEKDVTKVIMLLWTLRGFGKKYWNQKITNLQSKYQLEFIGE